MDSKNSRPRSTARKRVPSRFGNGCGSCPGEERRILGEDIADVEYAWPVGLPLCRAMSRGLWEVRSSLPGNRIARVLFCIAEGHMVLLHGFIKKTARTPKDDLALARKRVKETQS